jgi:6,7-dimethyl-8-ribityllumazine synthase
MLTPVQSKRLSARGFSFAIVASEFNSRYVDAMLRAARAELKRAAAARIKVVRVPGAYEIPLIVEHLARNASKPGMDHQAGQSVSAIICLGVILRGQTVHAAHIGEAVSRTLMEIQVRHQVPVVHEVLLLENEEQARHRCLSKTHNRGTEAAQTAVRMATVMKALHNQPPKFAKGMF